MQEKDDILRLEHIAKSFPGVRALSYVNLSFRAGEVLGLVGENVAGKSTLMKILSGVLAKDAGTVYFQGQPVEIRSPLHAKQLGLSIIFQELNLVESLSIAENMFVGRLPVKGVLGVDWRALRKLAEALLERVGLKIDSATLVGQLSIAQRQMVEIAKALSYQSKIIIMDEPTATLTTAEQQNLFAIVQDLRKNGVTVIYISHRLDEIFLLCDRVSVLRDGCVIDTRPIGQYSRESIIAQMVGRTLENEYPQRHCAPQAEIVLEVQGLTRKGFFEDISFALHKGEVLGLAGLVGSGRTEIVRAIFGADPFHQGSVTVRGNKVTSFSPRKSIARKLALLAEDRKQQGLILPATLSNNISLASLAAVSRFGVLHRRKEKQVARHYIDDIGIKAYSTEQKALQLSGGNQQKVVLAKWLFYAADIFILDEPTRGVDVGAKYEIYQQINHLVEAGKSVIMISSELPELIHMSDRLLVIYGGKSMGVLCGDEKTAEMVMKRSILGGVAQ